MGESRRHGRLCELLYQVLRQAVGAAHSVGKDNFVYFDASDPRKKCAPDAFVKLGVADVLFDSWKVWEHGAPELAVEILSPSDTPETLTWEEKMERYLALGVRELIALNTDAAVGTRLLAWDRIDNDLVPRVVDGETTPCLTLGLHWVVVESRAPSGEALTVALRLARDPAARELVLTREKSRKLRRTRGCGRSSQRGADGSRTPSMSSPCRDLDRAGRKEKITFSCTSSLLTSLHVVRRSEGDYRRRGTPRVRVQKEDIPMRLNPNIQAQVSADTALRDGLAKNHKMSEKLVLDGKEVKLSALVAMLDSRVRDAKQVDAMRSQLRERVARYHANVAGTAETLSTLRTQIIARVGKSAPALDDYGIAPRKTRAALTVEERASAIAKGKETRAARHTMGKKQRLAHEAAPPNGTPKVPAVNVVTPGTNGASSGGSNGLAPASTNGAAS